MHIPKINIPKKYVKICSWIIGSLFFALFVLGAIAYNKREALLQKVISKAINKAQMDYGLAVKIGSAGFTGFSTVKMTNISVVPKDRDSLVNIADLSVGVKLWPLLIGNVKLSEITLNNGKINVVLKDSITNIDFVLKRKKKDNLNNNSKVDLSDIAQNLLNQVLYKIPDNMNVKNLMFQLDDNDTAHVNLLTTTATIDDGDLLSTIKVNDTAAVWHVNGKVKPGKKQLNIKLFAENKKVELPYLENKLHTKVNFDTVQTELKDAGFSHGDFKISGSWSIKNLLINQKRIAATDIIVPEAKIDADMLVGENYVALDSTSTVYLQNATVHPYIKYTLKPNKIYELKLHADEQDAQNIFNAFPQGLFESLEGLQVQGKLKYDLDFYLDSATPDNVKFNSTLTPFGFKIVKWGKTNLQKINSEFVYTPYEYGKPMRNIVIGPSNPNFMPLDKISPNFKNALLTAEDPSFFKHKGFVEESIRKSIAVNYKEKKFKRGGSTISMQLVKNIYLSRQKTLSRKIEEILIVWLIENNNLVTKKRMLEVYFNVMELGQNIYGIGEASHHYFGKQPADLTIGEGLFLTNIVPKPKAAMYKFADDGGLKEYLLKYFKFIGNIMAKRGLTPPDSTGYGFYDVRLREGLRQYLQPDSTRIDTASFDDEDDNIPKVVMQDDNKNLFDRLFGRLHKKDTTRKETTTKADTTKSKRQLRQERRALRKSQENTFLH